MPSNPQPADAQLRLFVYHQLTAKGRCPTVSEMAKWLGCTARSVHASLARLGESHAFMTQDNGELWRIAPFSAIPTPFPVRIGKRSWYGNCIWDALGIPAMLGKDAHIDAACGCCNYQMPLRIRRGQLLPSDGIIHIAVPARDWYKDVVFT